MDSNLRSSVKLKLRELVKCRDFEHNNPTKVIKYIEEGGTSLADIWHNIEQNLVNIRAANGKDVKESQRAYTKAAFKLDRLGVVKLDEMAQKVEFTKIFSLIDEAIVNCPFETTSQLAQLFGLRSMALFESGQTDLALVAVNQALSLSPESILYHTYKARYLNYLDRHYEAYRLIKRFLRTLEVEENKEEIDLEMLKKFQADIDKRITHEQGLDSEVTKIEESDDEDCKLEASYNSDKDDCEEDFLDEACAEQSKKDKYSIPHGDAMKNFSFDYRCELKSTTQKGISVFAMESIPEKTIIFQEKAYSIAILSNDRLKKCHFCARDVRNRFWPCHKCNQMVYCADKCAALDWKLSHHYECGLTGFWEGKTKSNFHMFHMLNHVGVNNIIDLIEELKLHGKPQYNVDDYRTDQAQRLVQEVNKDTNMLRNGFSAQMCLIGHSDKYEVEYMSYNITSAIDCAIMACLVQDYEFEQISHLNLVELIGQCFVGVRRILNNAFRWSSHNSQGVKVHHASYFFLMGSTFNHSCDPNTDWTIDDNILSLNTLRSIQPGEEITISYGPSGDEYFEDRQKHLANNYYFQCQCSHCIKEASLVLALQCPTCLGPVLPNLINQAKDSPCMLCFKPFAQTNEKMTLLKRALKSLNMHGQLFDSVQTDACLHSMKQSLDLIRSLIYGQSVSLLESIYVLCKALRQKGLLCECLPYGTLVDSIMPLKGPGLIVLPAPKQTNQDKEKVSASAPYYFSKAFGVNIDHMIFWCSIYRIWIEQNNSKSPQFWIEMFRFYFRLRELIQWLSKIKKDKLSKIEPKDRFDSVDLIGEIDALERLKRYKQQEMEQVKQKYGNGLHFVDVQLNML